MILYIISFLFVPEIGVSKMWELPPLSIHLPVTSRHSRRHLLPVPWYLRVPSSWPFPSSFRRVSFTTHQLLILNGAVSPLLPRRSFFLTDTYQVLSLIPYKLLDFLYVTTDLTCHLPPLSPSQLFTTTPSVVLRLSRLEHSRLSLNLLRNFQYPNRRVIMRCLL